MNKLLHCAVGSYEGSLFGWDMLGNEDNAVALDMTFGFHCCHGSIRCITVSPNGKYLVCGGTDEMIRIFDVKTKKSVGDLTKHTGSITCLQFVGNGFLLSGSEDNTLCIWRVHDWQCLHILGGHKGAVNDIAVHPSGKVLLSVSRDNTIRLWNLITGKMAFTRSLKRPANKIKWDQSRGGEFYLIVFDTEVQNFVSADNSCTCVITKSQYVKIHQADYMWLPNADGTASNDLSNLRIVVLFDDRTLGVYDGTARQISSISLSLSDIANCVGTSGETNSVGKPKDFCISATSFAGTGDSTADVDCCVSVVTTNGVLLVFSGSALDAASATSTLDDVLLCCKPTSSEPRFTSIVTWNKASITQAKTVGAMSILDEVSTSAAAAEEAEDDSEEEQKAPKKTKKTKKTKKSEPVEEPHAPASSKKLKSDKKNKDRRGEEAAAAQSPSHKKVRFISK
jgi:WD40 repeat protein